MNRRQKNIVFILSDDQGAWSMRSYGNDEIVTPNLDAAAERGVCFENFYCTSPVCSPARASILTGRMPSFHGVLDWLGGGGVDKEAYRNIPLEREKALSYLRPDVRESGKREVTYGDTVTYERYMNYERGPIDYLAGQTCYTEILHENGYTCGLAGKWHLGNAMLPQKGFDFWRVVPRGNTPYMMPDRIVDGKPVVEYTYSTDLITDDAVEFLETRDQGKPFYLSLHYTAPHDPWRKGDQPKELWDLYKGCSFSSVPDEPLHPDQVLKRQHPETCEQRLEMIRAHFAAISGIDRQIGRLLAVLEERGELENTVFFYTADNGVQLGQHGIWGKGNGTFPMNLYETAVRVPFLMWGAGVPEGVRIERPSSHYDVFRTVLGLAEIAYEDERLPGVDLMTVVGDAAVGSGGRTAMTGSACDAPGDVVVCDEYGPVRMIRSGRYKLIYQYPYGPHFLFDLETDPEERRNLFGDEKYEIVRRRLFRKLEAWFERYTLAEHDGRLFPVDGEGQMNRLEKYGEDVVFKRFSI